MPVGAQLLIAVVIAAVLGGVGWYVVVTPMQNANAQQEALLKQKQADNANLEKYERDLPGLEREIASLQQQLAIQRTIVPDEKEAPEFMHMMQDTAASSGIDIRRYTTRPLVTREFYSEAPYELDIDGPYYAVVNFFEKVSKLQRIINIANLQVATVKKPSEAKVKQVYQYAPGETVVANCVATTFFSHDSTTAPATTAAKGK
jgi:type IV pilus assembly protein PilO